MEEYYNWYIKLSGNLLNWRWYCNTNAKVVFVHFLLEAAWKPKQVDGIQLQRGQRFVSLPNLAKILHMGMSSVRTALGHLKETGEISCLSYAQYHTIGKCHQHTGSDKH
ncbi:MAG: hypothetical protein ABF904_14775 [Ethanoligenens sp.]